jgi:uncharacterized RDD family membrane protein YckC
VGVRPYAGLVSRLVALVVDGFVVTLVIVVISGLPSLTWRSLSPLTVPRWLSTATSVIDALIPLVYFTAFWAMTGQTVGDRLMGIVVRRHDGDRISFARSLARAAVGLALAPVWLVGMLQIMGDHDRRAWHDYLLGTDVRYRGHRSTT